MTISSWRCWCLLLVALTGCDKAKSDYARCIELEARGDLGGASAACSAAVKADPESESGKAAAQKLDVVTKALAVAEAKRKTADAKRKATEEDERAQLLGPEAGSWEPVSASRIADWKTLVAKYPKSQEGERAAWKLTQQTSVCAHYAGRIPYYFMEYMLFEEEFIGAVASRISAWDESMGILDLKASAKSGQMLLEPKREALKAECDQIRQHQTLSGEEPVKQSILSDCSKLEKRFTRIHAALEPGLGMEGAVQLLYTLNDSWPRFSQETAPLLKKMIASADKRSTDCVKIGTPPLGEAKVERAEPTSAPAGTGLAPASVAASSHYVSGTQDLGHELAFDGDLTTAWHEGAPGPGRGEWIEARFGRPTAVGRITMSTGHDMHGPTGNDLFVVNAHVKRVRITFDGGHDVVRDVAADQRSLVIDDPGITATVVKFVFEDVWPGTKWPVLPISEISFGGAGT